MSTIQAPAGAYLPQPYYEQDGITIYHGDCREILPLIESGSIDLVLPDPPYGIGRDGSRESTGSHGGRKAYEFMGWDSAIPEEEVFAEIFRVSKHQVIWGGNYFSRHLPPSMGWLIWDKGQRIAGSDAELAFTSRQRALRSFTLNRVEIMLDGAEHPTQKPLKLMRWCLAHFPDAHTILDPFMGSGTTLRAAKDLGRKAIGIELEEKYCEIAVKRLSQQVLPLEVTP